MNFDFTPPQLTGMTPQEDIEKIRRWLIRISEELSFGLNNLDEGNIDSNIIDAITTANAAAEKNSEQINQLQALCRQVRTIVIPSGENLNDYMEPGKYIIPSGVVQGTIVNRPPISLSGAAVVEAAKNSTTAIQQIYRHCSKVNPQVWERSFFSGTWGSWHKIEDITGTMLWDGALYMFGSQTITLSESVSSQVNGIVLVFSRYDYNEMTPLDYQYNSFFVPKAVVKEHGGRSYCFNGFDPSFLAWAKFLYISDTSITGYDGNRQNGVSNGITYDNRTQVLRNVIGI